VQDSSEADDREKHGQGQYEQVLLGDEHLDALSFRENVLLEPDLDIGLLGDAEVTDVGQYK